MGMLKVAGKVTKKKVGGLFARKKERVDKGLPLGLMIGSRLSISVIEMMTVKREFPKLQLDLPNAPVYVRFYGVIKDAGFTVHRFYLATKVTDGDPDYMLQIVTDRDDSMVEGECKLFQSQREVYPDRDNDQWREGDTRFNEANWKWWLQEDEGIIGIEMFDDPEADNLRYFRDDAWGTATWVAPRKMQEVVYFDPYGESKESFSHRYMSYYRFPSTFDHLSRDDVEAVEGAPAEMPEDAPVEWCMITNIVSSIKGVRSSHVELFKGLSVKPSDLKIA